MLTQEQITEISKGNFASLVRADGSFDLSRLTFKEPEYVFGMSAKFGNLELLNAIIDTTPPEKHQDIIHIFHDEPFINAAAAGHLNVVNRLIELTPDQGQRRWMIHYDDDEAFTNAAAAGHLDVINRLIELTPDQGQRRLMIHCDDSEAFARAAAAGHLDVINRLIELTPRDWMTTQWIPFGNYDKVLEKAAAANHINIVNLLIESIPDAENRKMMAHSQDDEAFYYKNSATFFAVIFGDQDGRSARLPCLNEERITKLRELREELIKNFSEESAAEEAIKLSNIVIADLLTGENLKKTNDSVKNLWLIRKKTPSNSRSGLGPFANSLIIPFAFECPEFKGLDPQQRTVAAKVVRDFLSRGKDRVPTQGAAGEGQEETKETVQRSDNPTNTAPNRNVEHSTARAVGEDSREIKRKRGD